MKNEFTTKEKTKISHQLKKGLSPEYISVRPGHGNTKLTYLEGWTAISLANQIFGFDGWSSEIKEFKQEIFEIAGDKITVSVSCCCRITLKNGIFKEDVGFGCAENHRSKTTAIEKAKKEAITDSIKRALRQFGNALGNCCYDKDYIKLIHIAKNRGKISTDNLLKKSDFESQKEEDLKESVSFENFSMNSD